MRKLTVLEYAKQFGISSQAVYKRIKKGVLKVETEEGVQYILVDETELETHEIKNREKPIDSNTQLVEILKDQLKIKKLQIIKLNEQIEKLSSQLSQALNIQEETIEEKKQNNLLMAGLQKSLGLLEYQNKPANKKSFFRWFKQP